MLIPTEPCQCGEYIWRLSSTTVSKLVVGHPGEPDGNTGVVDTVVGHLWKCVACGRLVALIETPKDEEQQP